jgi:succinate dehydrogenase / fumarate reductase, iron-sulfur subunit
MSEVSLKIFRFDPGADKEPRFQTYRLDADPRESILSCLNRVKWEQDGTLAFRMSCGHGVCGSDGMKINGSCSVACQRLVKDFEGREIVIEPLPAYRVLKDLVVDLDPFFERVDLIRPYLITSAVPPEKERTQGHEESLRVKEAIRCILCACCTASCPVRNIENKQFIGPAPLVWVFRYIFDSRDEATLKRLAQMDNPDGAWGCKNYFECTRVCPKGIPVTKEINTIRREIQEKLKEVNDKKEKA